MFRSMTMNKEIVIEPS